MPRDRRRRDRRDHARPTAEPVQRAGAEIPHLAGKPVARQREWRWRTFPVFFTFAATLFVTSVLTAIVVRALGLNLIEILGALLFAAALSHLVAVHFYERRFPDPRDDRPPARGPSR